jgi:hypothetical protein
MIVYEFDHMVEKVDMVEIKIYPQWVVVREENVTYGQTITIFVC